MRHLFLIYFVFVCVLGRSQSVSDTLYLRAYDRILKGDTTVYNSIKEHDKNLFGYELCLGRLDKGNGHIHYKRALEKAKPGREKAIVFLRWGQFYLKNDNVLDAMACFTKADLNYNFPESDPYFFDINREFALVYSYSGKYDKSNERYRKMYAWVMQGNDPGKKSRLTNNMALNHIELKEYDKAEELMNLSLSERIKENNTFMLGQTYNNFGTLYFAKGDYPLALKFYEKGYHMRKTDPRIATAIVESEINIGKVYLKMNDEKRGENFLLAGLNRAREMGNLELVRRAEMYLKDHYASVGNYKKAFDTQTEYHKLTDSLFGLEKKEQINQLVIGNEFRNKIMADSLSLINHQQEIKYSVERDKNNKVIIVIVSLLLLIVIVFGIYLFKQNKLKQQVNELITKQSNQLKQSHKDIRDSIIYAKNLQDSMLPSLNSIEKIFKESFVLYMPKDIVSGDFYWVHEQTKASLPELDAQIKKRVFLALADCTGHGVPGSMVSLVGITSLSRCISEFKLTSPAKILDKMAVIIAETFFNENKQLNDGMDISLCCIEWRNDGITQLFWAGANNDLYLVRNEEQVELKPTRRPVGAYIKELKFEERSMQLVKGDALYLFTDGFGDQFGGPKGKKFKHKRLKENIFKNSKLELHVQKESLIKLFSDWKGALEQVDDISVIGFKID